MNLFEPARTAYDLNFRVGDIPVRVHPFFWLTAVVLGFHNGQKGAEFFLYLLIWVAILFVSILVHELGHVLMGRRYGASGHIVFTGLFGLAIGSSNLPERGQRIAVSLAGPGAGFLLAAGVLLILFGLDRELGTHYLFGMVQVYHEADLPAERLDFAIRNLLWVNLLWGLLNLLPIWPLDGGKVSRELCEQVQGRPGIRTSILISLTLSTGLAVVSLLSLILGRSLIPFLHLDDSLFPTLFFGLFAYGSYQLLRVASQLGSRGEEFQEEDEPRMPWEQDADWWKSGKSPWRD